MAVAVFVSYRRNDTKHVAGRLWDHLAQRLTAGNVFLDVASIDLAMDFRVAVRNALRRVDAVLLLIGAQFDVARLGSPEDVVRMELAETLAQAKPVFPVLVDGAVGPDRVATSAADRSSGSPS